MEAQWEYASIGALPRRTRGDSITASDATGTTEMTPIKLRMFGQYRKPAEFFDSHGNVGVDPADGRCYASVAQTVHSNAGATDSAPCLSGSS